MFNRSSTGNFRGAVVKSTTIDIATYWHGLRHNERTTERNALSTLGREMDQRERLRHMRNEMEVIEVEINYRLHGELVPSGD